MFKKKSCEKCGNKISDKYEFCPYCGNPLNKNSEEDLGMLGKTDTESFKEMKLPTGLNIIFNSLIKNLSKQINELNRGKKPIFKKPFNKGVSISISTSGNLPPEIKINSFGNAPGLNQKQQTQKKFQKKVLNNISKENFKKSSNLPREEPSTNIRRFSDRIVYEIDLPKVNSMKDVSIVKLENSIEIKALGKNKVYSKLISVGLPIINYEFEKGKLILEFGVRN